MLFILSAWINTNSIFSIVLNHLETGKSIEIIFSLSLSLYLRLCLLSQAPWKFSIHINIDNDSGDLVGFMHVKRSPIFSEESTHQVKRTIRLIRLWFGILCGCCRCRCAVAIHSIWICFQAVCVHVIHRCRSHLNNTACAKCTQSHVQCWKAEAKAKAKVTAQIQCDWMCLLWSDFFLWNFIIYGRYIHALVVIVSRVGLCGGSVVFSTRKGCKVISLLLK